MSFIGSPSKNEMDDRLRTTKTEKGFGQNGLYWQLLRNIALHQRALGEKKSVQKLMDDVHLLFQMSFNFKVPYPEMPDLREPQGTSCLSVTEFLLYFQECEKAAALIWGVTAFKEDKKEFDHGFPKSE